jgi:putative ABC transport system ATP-binding protein
MNTQSSSADSIVLLRAVEKSFVRGGQKIAVLSGLSLDMGRGEFVALMGPSGSGKTTLLNLIAGLDSADAGEVVIDGTVINRLSDAELSTWRAHHLGFVFQSFNLLPVLTAIENVALPLALFSLRSAEKRERAAFALELVGLGDRKEHYPSQLSGGQEQRVAIARAIVTDPALIIADEPTGDLDRDSAGEIMSLLGTLNRRHGKSVVMVTHDPVAAESASRIVRLDKGRLIGESTGASAR